MKKKVVCCVVLIVLIFYNVEAQVNLHKSNANPLGADSYITTPIHQNMDVVYSFTLILLFIIGIVISYKIYARWQLGEEDILQLIVRWWGGLIACFFIIQFLKMYLEKQSFGEFSNVNF